MVLLKIIPCYKAPFVYNFANKNDENENISEDLHTQKNPPKFWTIYFDSEIEKEVGLQKLPKNHNIPPSIKEEWGTLDRAGTSTLGCFGCYKSCPERTFKSLGVHANLSSY